MQYGVDTSFNVDYVIVAIPTQRVLKRIMLFLQRQIKSGNSDRIFTRICLNNFER